MFINLGGGITHVTMVKKEASGRFELTVEQAREYIGPVPQIRVKEQRQEAMEFMRTLEREVDAHAGSEAVVQCANFWSARMHAAEFRSENAQLSLSIGRN